MDTYRDDPQIVDANRLFLDTALSIYSGMDEAEARLLKQSIKVLRKSIRGLSDNGALELLAKIGIEMAGRKIEFSHAQRDVMNARKKR